MPRLTDNQEKAKLVVGVFTSVAVLTLHVLLITNGWRLMRGSIPPNPYIGIRTTRTLSDPEVWYQVNAQAGKIMFVAGLLVLPVAVLFTLAIFMPQVRSKLRINQAEAIALLAITTLVYVFALLAG